MAKTLTTFERRNRLLTLLHERPGIRVPDIGALLEVTEGTVRNDLNALAGEGRLQRVRGGGIPADEQLGYSAAFAARLSRQRVAKLAICCQAAEMVADGDTLLCDASTTAYYMAHFLKERHHLTVVTNGIELGRKLAQDATNTVMLLGGMLNADGVPVTDLVSDQFLREMHITTAFVSCAGFMPEVGLTERDIREAQLKSKMIAAAGCVVALIDAAKYGKSYIAPFVRLERIARIFSDSSLDQGWVDRLAACGAALTLCELPAAA